MESFKEFSEAYITESLMLDEASSVTFGGEMYPKSGWCVILAGGPGSGKGFQQKDAIMIDAKVFDVDELKSKYIKAAKADKIKNDPKKGNYDLKNGEDTQRLHELIKVKGYDDKIKSIFYNTNLSGNKNRTEHLPNIIYDITGKNPLELANISGQMRGAGYKISLIWVVTDRNVALMQNLTRSRVVPQKVFHTIHNTIQEELPKFITMQAGKYFDECWILFSSTKKHPFLMTKEEAKDLKDNRAYKLTKNENGFELDDELKKRLYTILGSSETDPDNPKVYSNYATVKKNMANNPLPKMKKKPNLGDFLRNEK